MNHKRLLPVASLGILLSTPVIAAGNSAITQSTILPAATSPWTGPYAGLNVSYGWSNPSTVYGSEYALPPLRRVGPTGASWSLQSPLMNGFLGGAQLGYNYQVIGSGAVVGAEVDFQGSGMSGTTSGIGSKNITGRYFPFASTSQSVDWFGTIRGRMGYTILPALLAYATGGFAYGGGRNSYSVMYSDLKEFGGSSASYARTGWTAGGGIEWLMWNNWSMKAEYLYVDLGQTPSLSGEQYCLCSGPSIPKLDYFMSSQSGGSNRFHTLRAGVNYHFSWSNVPLIGFK